MIVDKHIDLNVYKEAKSSDTTDELKPEDKTPETKDEMRLSCCGSSNAAQVNKENIDQLERSKVISDMDFNDWVG